MHEAEGETHLFYNEDASRYDQRWETPGGRYTAKVQADIVKEVCYRWAGKSVLEAGCGTGRFSALLSSIGVRLTVVDISPAMLCITRSQLSKLKAQNVEGHINASIYALPFDDESFQAVLSINVFSHLNYPLIALKELARVLAPGGLCLVNFPNLCSYFFLPAMVVNSRRKSLGKDVFSVWYRPRSVLNMLHQTGYEVLGIKGHVHIPRWLDMPLARSVLRFLDHRSRDSWLSRYAPIWFVECRKP
jgi:ubiquinone/menaquinone biosynthesis C-methylase UbiE